MPLPSGSAAGDPSPASLSVPAGRDEFRRLRLPRYLHGQRIHWLLGADGAAAVQTGAGSAGARAVAAQPYGRHARRARQPHGGLVPGRTIRVHERACPRHKRGPRSRAFRQFAQLGLTHILAISGLHVAVFLYVLGGLLRLLRMTRERCCSS